MHEILRHLMHEGRNILQELEVGLEFLKRALEDRPHASAVAEQMRQSQERFSRMLQVVQELSEPMVAERRPFLLKDVWSAAWCRLVADRELRDLSLEEEPGADEIEAAVDPLLLEEACFHVFDWVLGQCRDPVRIRVACSVEERRGESLLRLAFRHDGPPWSEGERRGLLEAGGELSPALVRTRRILEAHGGGIAFESPGEGAGVAFLLPQAVRTPS